MRADNAQFKQQWRLYGLVFSLLTYCSAHGSECHSGQFLHAPALCTTCMHTVHFCYSSSSSFGSSVVTLMKLWPWLSYCNDGGKRFSVVNEALAALAAKQLTHSIVSMPQVA
jgi:hypothetical protein